MRAKMSKNESYTNIIYGRKNYSINDREGR